MNRSTRIFASLLLATAIIAATASTAFAGTITVKLHARYNFFSQLSSWRNPATIYVYGPNKYYRSRTVCGWWSLKSTDNVACTGFTDAPNGDYRVRVDWSAGNGSKARQDNSYFYTWWLFPNKTLDFTSP